MIDSSTEISKLDHVMIQQDLRLSRAQLGTALELIENSTYRAVSVNMQRQAFAVTDNINLLLEMLQNAFDSTREESQESKSGNQLASTI